MNDKEQVALIVYLFGVMAFPVTVLLVRFTYKEHIEKMNLIKIILIAILSFTSWIGVLIVGLIAWLVSLVKS